jgi:cell division septation protein DedD
VTIGRHAGGLTRVLVGPFADQASAAPTLRQLAAGGHRPFIARE